MKDIVLLGVATTAGRIVVPITHDDPAEGPRFSEPEHAVAWIELGDRADADLFAALTIALRNWDHARVQIESGTEA